SLASVIQPLYVASRLLTLATIPTRSGQAITRRKVRIRSHSRVRFCAAARIRARRNRWRIESGVFYSPPRKISATGGPVRRPPDTNGIAVREAVFLYN